MTQHLVVDLKDFVNNITVYTRVQVQFLDVKMGSKNRPRLIFGRT